MQNIDIMTFDQVCEFLHLGKATLYKMVKNKEIPCVQIGRLWRFDKEQIEKWFMEKQKGVINPVKILIVEDDPIILEIISEKISDEIKNAELCLSNNGMDALSAVGEFKPEVIILDINMPRLDGIEVCSWLKNDPTKKDIYIIALTGYTDRGYKEKVLAAGADEYLEKPMDWKNWKELTKLITERAGAKILE